MSIIWPARIGSPSLVVCLNSGCGNYDQLWLTTSLRGIVAGTLTVAVLDGGRAFGRRLGHRAVELPHPAAALLSRLEDEATGAIRPEALYAQIPAERLAQAKRAAAALGERGLQRNSRSSPARGPMADDLTELVLNRTWRPQLAVTGIDGLPAPENAGNVLLPYTTAKLSLRLPPTLDAGRGRRHDVQQLCWRPIRPTARRSRSSPPGRLGRVERAGPGALARSLAGDARRRTRSARRPPIWARAAASRSWRCSASKFPAAQFVVTGVLGPHSNAHGPNEFLHIPTGKTDHRGDRPGACRPSRARLIACAQSCCCSARTCS